MEQEEKLEIIKEEVMSPDKLFKVIIVGDAGVGKSCILYRATKDDFKENYEVTIGAEYNSLTFKIHGKMVRLHLWDTAGQEGFRSMTRIFYKGSHCAILVYDVTKKESYAKIEQWLSDIKDNASPDVKICLVGNQKDKNKEREISFDQGQEFADKNELLTFVETSAKTGEGIIDLISFIAKVLYLDSEKTESAKLEKGYILEKRHKKKKKGCCS